jgi:hypothetical protein
LSILLSVHKHNSIGGRPKQVAEFIEGKAAAANFFGAMRQILSNPKANTEVQYNEPEKRRKTGK